MSGGGEPGVASTPNIDVRVARTAALNIESQRVLAGGAQSPEQAALIHQANEARGLLSREDPARPLEVVEKLADLFGDRQVKTPEVEVTPRAQAEKRDDSVVSRSGDPNLEVGESFRTAEIQIAGEVARRIIETGRLQGQDMSKIARQLDALKILIPKIAGISLDDPHAIVAFVNSELKNPQVMEAFIRRYNELQGRDIPPDTRLSQEILDQARGEAVKANQRREEAGAEGVRLAERRRSLMPEPGNSGELKEELDTLEADTNLDLDLEAARGKSDRAKAKWMKKASEPGADPVEVNEAREAYITAKGDYDRTQAKISRRDELKDEREGGLDAAIAKNKTDIQQAISDLEQAQAVVRQAEVNLNAVRSNRLEFEASYIRDYVEMLAASIAEVNDARAEIINNRLMEEAQKNGTEMDKFMAKRVKLAYSRIITKGTLRIETIGKFRFHRRAKSDEIVPDLGKGTIDVERELLGRNGIGPKGILRRELIKAYGKDANGKVDPRVDQLMSDPSFVNRWAVEFAFAAINAHLQNGGTLNAGQIAYMESRGKLGEALVNRVKNSEEVRAAEAKMQESGELTPGGFKQALSTEEGKKKYFALIFQIAAGTWAPAAAAAAVGAAHH